MYGGIAHLIGAIGKMSSQTAETTLQNTIKSDPNVATCNWRPRQYLRHAQG
jgi:hypothetical protein